MQETEETRVQSLGREDPLEEEMANYSSILAWRIPVNRGAWWAIVQWFSNSWTQLSNQGQHNTAQEELNE